MATRINPNSIDEQIAECRRRLETNLDPASRKLEERELQRLLDGEEEFYLREAGREDSHSPVGDWNGMREA